MQEILKVLGVFYYGVGEGGVFDGVDSDVVLGFCVLEESGLWGD